LLVFPGAETESQSKTPRICIIFAHRPRWWLRELQLNRKGKKKTAVLAGGMMPLNMFSFGWR